MKKMKFQAVLVLAVCLLAGNAWARTDVSVNINGYLPAPPGVQVVVVGGRPAYREGGRVVYLEKEKGHRKKGHGRALGHRKHENEGKHGDKHGRHD
jgi:hypothetical protein